MDAATSPDPISEPKAYQDYLLSLLGPDDPSQLQSRTPDAWRALVSTAGEPGTPARNRRSGPRSNVSRTRWTPRWS